MKNLPFWFKTKLIVFGTFEDVEKPFEVSSDTIVVNETRFDSSTHDVVVSKRCHIRRNFGLAASKANKGCCKVRKKHLLSLCGTSTVLTSTALSEGQGGFGICVVSLFVTIVIETSSSWPTIKKTTPYLRP